MLYNFFPFPIFLGHEGRFAVAACPLLDLATQGETEEEAKSNLKDLIEEYLADPDMAKPAWNEWENSSFTYLPIPVPQNIFNGQIASTAAVGSN
jgi:predicted RNase H-like HicB family nuclease